MQLGIAGVQHVAFVVAEANARSTNRAIKGQARNCQRSRGTDHRRDVRILSLVGGNNGTDHLHFVEETFREQRADRTVDQTRGQGFLLGRPAFALKETAGDTASGVGFFLIVHGQREETLARISLLGTDYGHQHTDSTHVNQHSAGGLTSDTPGFEGDGLLTELE